MATITETTADRILARVPMQPGGSDPFSGVINQPWLDANRAALGAGSLAVYTRARVWDALTDAGLDPSNLTTDEALTGDQAIDFLALYIFMRDYWAAYPQSGKDCEDQVTLQNRRIHFRRLYCEAMGRLNLTDRDYCTTIHNTATASVVTDCN